MKTAFTGAVLSALSLFGTASASVVASPGEAMAVDASRLPGWQAVLSASAGPATEAVRTVAEASLDGGFDASGQAVRGTLGHTLTIGMASVWPGGASGSGGPDVASLVALDAGNAVLSAAVTSATPFYVVPSVLGSIAPGDATAAVPLPAGAVLFLSGIAGTLAVRRRTGKPV